MQIDKPLYNKKKILEWEMDPFLEISKKRSKKDKKLIKFFVLLILILLFLLSKMDLMQLVLLGVCGFLLAAGFIASHKERSSTSSFKYKLDEEGITVSDLNNNEKEFHSWDSLDYYYTNINKSSLLGHLMIYKKGAPFVIVKKDKKRVIVETSSKEVYETENLIASHIPFKYTKIKRNRMFDFIVLVISLIIILIAWVTILFDLGSLWI